MTASSVEFFPCRVQLMDLPRSSTRLATSNSLVNSIRPPVAKIRGISRNLFGAPDPKEMKSIYQKEAERIRSYVLQRYNFDTKTSKATNEGERPQQQPTDKSNTNQTTINPAMLPTQIPTLIQQELRQHEHEQRLQDEEHNLNRVSETIPSNELIPIQIKSGSNVTRRCCEYSLSLLPAAERQKPYTRQSLLKECFNIRKNKVCATKCVNQCNRETISLENSQNSHRNIEILQLHQCTNSQPKEHYDKDNGVELTTGNEVNNEEHDGIKRNICNDNCTFSLQLVVSTQNVS